LFGEIYCVVGLSFTSSALSPSPREGGDAPARSSPPKSVSGSKESATITDLVGLVKRVCRVRSIV